MALDLNIFKDILNLIDKANIHIDMDAYMYIAGLLSSYLQMYQLFSDRRYIQIVYLKGTFDIFLEVFQTQLEGHS